MTDFQIAALYREHLRLGAIPPEWLVIRYREVIRGQFRSRRTR